MTKIRDINLINQAKNAVQLLMIRYRYGSYRVIRDPEGVVSLWAIEGNARAPFSISFVDKGRVYINIEDISPDFLRAFLDYVRRSVR